MKNFIKVGLEGIEIMLENMFPTNQWFPRFYFYVKEPSQSSKPTKEPNLSPFSLAHSFFRERWLCLTMVVLLTLANANLWE